MQTGAFRSARQTGDFRMAEDYTFQASKRKGYSSNAKGSGNNFVSNIGLNPLVNFNFMLRVEGIMDVPCKSVSAFTKENEFEYIKEGGLNDYVHLKRKQIQKPFTFTVERYVGTDILDPLPLGAELILPVLLFVSRFGNRFDVVERTYTFTGCTVISKEYGRLDAEKSGLLTENVTIAYRELLVIDAWGDIELEENNQFKKKDKPDNAIYNTHEVRRDNMKKVTEYYDLFEFDGDTVGVRSMFEQKKRKEKSLDDMIALAKKNNKYAFKKGISFRQDKEKDTDTLPAGAIEGRARYNIEEYRKSEMDDADFRDAFVFEEEPKPVRTMEKTLGVKSNTEGEDYNELFEFDDAPVPVRSMQEERGITELTKEQMEQAANEANKYEFKKGITHREDKGSGGALSDGGVEGNARYNDAEYRRAEMEQEAVSYNFDKKPVRTMESHMGRESESLTKMKNKAEEYKWVKDTGSENRVANTETLRAATNSDEVKKADMSEKYEFADTSTFGGTPVRTMETYKGMQSVSRKNMEDEAEVYGFDGKPVRTMEAHKGRESASQKSMESKAQKYDINGTDKRGNRQRLRSTPAPHETVHPTPRIWQPVKKK